jgi:ATP-dependent Clp protease, protease subunit
MATIYILDEIGPEGLTDRFGNWIPTVSAKSIINQLAWLPPGEAVEVVINSPGGSVFEGISIYNILKARGNVTTKVCGVAASISAVIFCAGANRLMGTGSFLMIHNPIVPVAGDESAHMDAAKSAKAMAENYASMIAGACGKPVEEILAMMAEETWINALDSVALGIATAIDEDAQELKIAASIADLYHNIPGEIMSKMQTTGGASASAAIADATDAVLEKIEAFKALSFEGFDFMACVKEKLTPEQAVAKMYEGLKAKYAEIKAELDALKAAPAVVEAPPAIDPVVTVEATAKAETANLLATIQNAGKIEVPAPGEVIDHRAVMATIKDHTARTAYWKAHIQPTLGSAYKV